MPKGNNNALDISVENGIHDSGTYVNAALDTEGDPTSTDGIELTRIEKNKDVEPNNAVDESTSHVDDGKQNGDPNYDGIPQGNAKMVYDDEDNIQARCWRHIYGYTDGVKASAKDNKTMLKYCIIITLLAGYAAYLIYACIYDFDAAFVVLIITSITVAVYVYILIRNTRGEWIYDNAIQPAIKWIEEHWRYIMWPLYIFIIAGLAVGLYFVTRNTLENLISCAGLIFFIAFSYVFSKYPHRVKWRPVLWGLALQLILGLFILRTQPGFILFEWLSDVVFAFLNFSSAGAIFLFGESYQEHYFAFVVLPIVIYFSSVISVLYYWGVMQVIIEKIAWLMQRTMQTSASESLNAAGNIFVGMTEAPLMIKPYLKDMTRSEIHAVMTGGFATVAGSTLGAYILGGIDATHLITASVMSAPAALAISKLFYPETDQSKHTTIEGVKLEKTEERNVVEAAANGASMAIPLVLNIAANLVAFLSLLALLNALLGYFGGLVGYPQLTFELVCSYVFMPLAFIMGVQWSDCRIVAELIGLKTFVNEFYAYQILGGYIENRETGNGPTLSLRSEIIATYALCGFANIGSIGIMLGGLTPMAPNKKADLAAVAIRALIAGTVACFMTACVAGILYEELPITATNATAIPGRTTVY